MVFCQFLKEKLYSVFPVFSSSDRFNFSPFCHFPYIFFQISKFNFRLQRYCFFLTYASILSDLGNFSCLALLSVVSWSYVGGKWTEWHSIWTFWHTGWTFCQSFASGTDIAIDRVKTFTTRAAKHTKLLQLRTTQDCLT